MQRLVVRDKMGITMATNFGTQIATNAFLFSTAHNENATNSEGF